MGWREPVAHPQNGLCIDTANDPEKRKTKQEILKKFKYDSTSRTLVCSNAPGVTELTELYNIFINRPYNYNKDIALKNILQIKRAGDYSQIWFCKR